MPAPRLPDADRLEYLDGLRGAAAIQVLVSHCVLAFAPAYMSRLGFVADGDFAVLLFFVMSGFVLTFSFERRPRDLSANSLGRVVRLGIPLVAVSWLTFLVLATLPPWQAAVAAMSNSEWLGSKAIPGLWRTAADGTGLSMFLGAAETTLFGSLAPFLPSIDSSPVGPAWSLHVELWGSLLVLGLVWAQTISGETHACAVAACIVLVGGNALGLFALGHLAAVGVRSTTIRSFSSHPATQAAAYVGVATAILIAGHDQFPGLWLTQQAFSFTEIVAPYEWFRWNKLVAAVLFFGSLLFLAPVQRALSIRPLRWLGRMSFSIYLLHVPVLLSVGCGAYLVAVRFGPIVGALAGAGTVLVATLLLAVPFERWVDRAAIGWSRGIRGERQRGEGRRTEKVDARLPQR